MARSARSFRWYKNSPIAVCLVALGFGCSTWQASGQQPSTQPQLPETLQGGLGAPVPHKGKNKARENADRSLPEPELSIPAGPLGFAPPAPFYLGSRLSQVSLNFLDESHLLFTFRVPGLISREHKASSQPPGEPPTIDEKHNERHVRAVVLDLPSGKVSAEALWRLHDAAPYLLMLKNQKFLLRDRNTVRIGDAGLHLDLFLRFPGSVSFLETSPDERLLVASTTEQPAPAKAAESEHKNSDNGSADSSPDRGSDPNHEETSAEEQTLLRILRMDNRSVLLFSRVEGVKHLPIDGDGFYEALRGSGSNWMISFQDFHGASIPLANVESACSPALDVMASGVVLVSSCSPYGGRKLSAVTQDKRNLWEVTTPPTKVWPMLSHSAGGLRLARETLDVSHAVGPNFPLDMSDIRGETVQVYDLANGKLELTVPASPILDGGGNFALSPSGNRLAVLSGGAIQIFNLPVAPALTVLSAHSSTAAKP